MTELTFQTYNYNEATKQFEDVKKTIVFKKVYDECGMNAEKLEDGNCKCRYGDMNTLSVTEINKCTPGEFGIFIATIE